MNAEEMEWVGLMSAYEVIEGPEPGVLFDAHTFLDYLRRSNQRWWEGAKDSFTCPWVFRGHAYASWGLVPSAARPLSINKLSPLVEKMRKSRATIPRDECFPEVATLNAEAQEAIRLCLAYFMAIVEFRSLSVELGVAGFDRHLWSSEEINTGSLCLILPPLLEKTLPVAFLAQHHGIPTFLLDWTRRPEVAAQFAARNENLPESTGDIAVFALRFESGHDGYGSSVLGSQYFRWIDDAPIKNGFLAAQHGMFTTHGSMDEFITTGRYHPLEKKLDALDSQEVLLKKMVLKASEVPLLRRLLDRENLSDAHLKPTLDNVARTIMARWSLPD